MNFRSTFKTLTNGSGLRLQTTSRRQQLTRLRFSTHAQKYGGVTCLGMKTFMDRIAGRLDDDSFWTKLRSTRREDKS